MKKVLCNIIITIMMAAFICFLILDNFFRYSVPVMAPVGSYAEEYSKQHHLKAAEIPDTLNIIEDIHYESFKYNVDYWGIILEGYEGKSEEIVIPYSIGGVNVVGLSETFIANSPSLKRIYISDYVTEINCDPSDSVEIVVSSRYFFKSDLEDKGWKISEYVDSEEPIFDLGDIPYEYSVKNDGIHLMSYTGYDSILVIPSYINGIPVTGVDFDMLVFDAVVFPDTVIDISGELYVDIITDVFVIETIITVIGFVFVLLVLNTGLFRLARNKKEYVLSGSQIVLSFVYFVIQIAFAVWSIYFGVLSWWLCALISILALGVFLILVIFGKAGRKQAVSVEKKVKESTDYMKSIKVSVSHLADGINDKETERIVNRVVDEIQYSDPSSNEELKEIEEKIKDSVDSLKNTIASGDKEAIRVKCEEVIKDVRERNEKCKALK